jgi:hypothetical protein
MEPSIQRPVAEVRLQNLGGFFEMSAHHDFIPCWAQRCRGPFPLRQNSKISSTTLSCTLKLLYPEGARCSDFLRQQKQKKKKLFVPGVVNQF